MMDNQEFTKYVIARLDELKKETGKSSFSNAKTNFKKAILLKVTAEPSLAAVYTDKKLFYKYGKDYLTALSDIERARAAKEKRQPKFATAQANKGALKPIFEVIGKEVSAMIKGRDRATKAAEENTQDVDLDGLNFCETFKVICEKAFPNLTEMEIAKELAAEHDGIKVQTYYKWLKGYGKRGNNLIPASPNKKQTIAYIKVLTHFEVLCGVTKGTLTKFMPSGVALVPKEMTALYDVPPRIETQHDFTAKVKEQFNQMESYYLQQGGSSNLAPSFPCQHINELQMPVRMWTTHPEEGCVTGNHRRQQIVTYQQWLLNKGYIETPDDFDLSYLLIEQMLNAFVKDRLNDGVFSNTSSLLSFIRTAMDGKDGDTCYLSLIHAPVEYMGYSTDVAGLAEWKRDEKSLKKTINQWLSYMDKNKEALEGSRNIQWLFDAKLRSDYGLEGGVKEGANEYMQIIKQLELDGKALGNNIGGGTRGGTGYGATMVALLMRLMLQQPMRRGNWQSLRLGTQVEARKAKYPIIWKANGRYHLRVPAKYVKNRRLLETTFNPILNKHLDYYLKIRADRLAERNDTSNTTFFVGYAGGSIHGSTVVDFTYKACKVLWADRDFITWGFNPHSLRHFVATLYLADNPQDIYRLALLLADRPETVMQTYAKPDLVGVNDHHSSWAAQYA